MPKQERFSTKYVGVYYVFGDAIGREGKEKIYYVRYRRGEKMIEEKVGRQYVNDMTPAKANQVRSRRIEGEPSNEEKRAAEAARKKAEDARQTIGRLWEKYAENRGDGKSFRTDKGRYEKYIKPLFEDKEPFEILPLDIERLKRRGLKGKSPQTQRHVLNLLDRIVNYGVKKGISARLPFKIEKPRVNNIKTEDLTPEQLKRLLKAIDESPYTIPALMMKMVLFTGLRRSEMLRLKWSDVDFHRGFITIREPKGGKDQTIPLNDSARVLLKSLPRESEFVFPGRRGKQRVDVHQAIKTIKEKAGLPAAFRGLHGLRHVYASMLASSGEVDIYTLQKLLTHKDTRMTNRYAHLRDEALKKASNVAGQIIESIKKTKVKRTKKSKGGEK